MNEHDIQSFLAETSFAVAGASSNRAKYGNKVLRCYQQHDLSVVAIHPIQTDVEGAETYKSLADIPQDVGSLSIITPPAVTEQIVRDAITKNVKHIWMQPGAESAEAIETASQAGITVIAGGPCILVVLGFREE